jgi:hypothetical protein
VSTLDPVLDLLRTSRERWQTLRLEGHEWRHVARLQEAFLTQASPKGLVVLRQAVAEDGEAPEETSEPWRLWLAKPDKIRAEFQVGTAVVTAVFVGDRWWSWGVGPGVRTNQGNPRHGHGVGPGEALVETARLLDEADLTLQGRAEFLARPVHVVLAVPKPAAGAGRIGPALYGLGVGAEECRLLVDVERGVVLRSEALGGGLAFRVIAADSVAFDEAFPSDAFSPPPTS